MGIFSEAEIDDIREQLQCIESSTSFVKAVRMVRLLRYLVEEVIAGRENRLNQTKLGIDVFDRDASFDPAVDSIVRVEASRLRSKLGEYYSTDGRNDPIRFEIPKGGYEVTIHSEPHAGSNTPSAQRADEITYGVASAIADAKPRSPGMYSIIVLPFEALTTNPEDEGLVDGITTEIINAVAQTGSFDVASHHSAFAYKGQNKDTREIGQELNVNYALEGSLRRAGNRVRVAMALIDTRSNRQVWADSYDHDVVDLFDLQEQLGRTVAATLGSVLWRASMDEAQRNPLDQLDAADFVDRANAIFFNYSQRSFENGKELIRSVKNQEQQYGHADAMLAFILAHEMCNAWTDRLEEARVEALAAADRAIDLDPRDSWVLGVTSEALIWLGEAKRAVNLSERAVASAPDNTVSFARARLGNALLHVDRGEQGLEQIQLSISAFRGERFTPPWHHLMRCWAYTHLERYAEAAVAGRKAVDRQTGTPFSSEAYANALANTGEFDEARLALADLHRMSPQLTLEHLEWLYQMAFETEEIAERYLSGLRKLDWL
jgi:TolB-like protein